MAETVKIEGLDALNARLGRILQQMNATDDTLGEIALDLEGKSQAIVPHDTGDLEGNAYVQRVKPFAWEVGYASPYAIIQHESLDFQHEPGREAKYLEQPFKANVKNYQQAIADAAGEALK